MPNHFGLFFARGGRVLRLPVNPERLPEVREAENGEYNVLGIGPVMQPRIPRLRVVTISSFFPGRPFAGVLTAGGFLAPETYIDFFRSAMDDRATVIYTPVRYYEDGTPFMEGDEGMTVLVTAFTTEERGGETGDFYYDLTLTEYRDYTPQTAEIRISSAAAEPILVTRTQSRDVPDEEIVVGDTVVVNGDGYTTPDAAEADGTNAGEEAEVVRIAKGGADAWVYVLPRTRGIGTWVMRSSLRKVMIR